MKVLISTSTFGVQCPEPLERLQKAGFEILMNPYGRRLRTPELLQLLNGVIGLIAGTELLTEEVFSHASALRVISRCGSGLDTIDAKAAHRRGIHILSTPAAPAQGVAELTVGLILGVLRRIAEADRGLRGGKWKPLMGNLLQGKVVGLVGLGHVGRRVVELLEPFQCTVLARERKPERAFVKRHRVRLGNLSTLLRRSDVLLMHVTLDDETRGMIGAPQLALMKPSAILINTARGELVDNAALATALKNDQIKGAGLDVYQSEPYQGPLTDCPNTLLTCHMGTYAAETRVSMEQQAVENLIRALTSLRKGKGIVRHD
jgi:D-3-phosphoglycerate dehydrogenase / 2-oxoglutarate reductase